MVLWYTKSSAKQKSALLITAHDPALKQLSHTTTGKANPEPFNLKQCPCCKKETMETVLRFNQRGPPPFWKELAINLLESIKHETNAGVQKMAV